MKKVFYGWWIVGACFLIMFCMGGVVFYGFTAFFEPIRREFGWSYTQISFAASLRGMEIGLFAPVVGIMVDRFGSRKLILLGMVIVGLGLILLSRTQTLAMFYGSSLLIAFGAGGCALLVTMSVVVNWFRRRAGIALGVMMSGVGAGGLIIPLIVWLIDSYGWRSTLVTLGAGMWVLGIPLSFVIRNRPEQYGYLPDGEAPWEPISNPENKGDHVEIGLREALTKKAFWYLSVAEAIRMLTVSAVMIHVMPYLSTMGIPRATAGMVAGAIPLFSIMGRFGLGWLGDVFDKRYVLAITFIMISAGMLAFCYMRVMWVALLFLLIFSPGYGGGVVLRGSILREYFGRDSFGKILGITLGLASVGGIIGPTLAGWVFDSLGNYHVVWLGSCGLCALAVWLVLRMR